MVNGRSITMLQNLDTALKPNDEVALFPPIGGGSKFPYNGYTGEFLRINLTEDKIVKESLPVELAKQYIGGSGLAAHYLFNEAMPLSRWIGIGIIIVGVFIIFKK